MDSGSPVLSGSKTGWHYPWDDHKRGPSPSSSASSSSSSSPSPPQAVAHVKGNPHTDPTPTTTAYSSTNQFSDGSAATQDDQSGQRSSHRHVPLGQYAPGTSVPPVTCLNSHSLWDSSEKPAKNDVQSRSYHELDTESNMAQGGWPMSWLEDPEMPFNWKQSVKWRV